MRYMIIVKATRDSEAGVMPNEGMLAAMAEFHQQLAAAGVLADANGLQASARGWRIRYDGDRRTVVDGPFAETKELIAGYTLIKVGSKEEALDWTLRFPNPVGEDRAAEIEVRQVFELDDFEPGAAVDRFRELETCK